MQLFTFALLKKILFKYFKKINNVLVSGTCSQDFSNTEQFDPAPNINSQNSLKNILFIQLMVLLYCEHRGLCAAYFSAP